MSHERIRGQRQRLVEHEQGDEVVRERDPHGGGDGDCEAGVEPRLVLLVVRAHVPDGVDRGDEPQEPRHQREQHAERLDHELQRDSRHEWRKDQAGPPALRNLRVDSEHAREHEHRSHQGHRLAEIRRFACKHDEPARQQWQDETSEHQEACESPHERAACRGHRAQSPSAKSHASPRAEASYGPMSGTRADHASTQAPLATTSRRRPRTTPRPPSPRTPR